MTSLDSTLKDNFEILREERAYSKSVKKLDKIVAEEEFLDSNYSHHNFFKSEKWTMKIKKAI